MHLLIKVDYFAVLVHVFTVVAFQNHPVLQWNGNASTSFYNGWVWRL